MKRHIDTHYNQPFTLEELAQIGRLSVSHLSASFRDCFGLCAHRIPDSPANAARVSFLRDTNLRISEIASLVGYRDVYYFSKHFKTHHGECPREFRRRAVRVVAKAGK